MKHLSRDKLAKYHRFSYQPRFYKEDKEAFKFRVATIERQLENQIAPQDVSSQPINSKARYKRKNSIKFLTLSGCFFGFLGVLFYMPISVYSVTVLFILAFAFIKISKK